MNNKYAVALWIASTIALGSFAATASELALKDVYADHFLIGGAVNRWQFTDASNQDVPIIEKHFNYSRECFEVGIHPSSARQLFL